MADPIVVDSSVLIKWVKSQDEDLLDEAHELLTQVERRPLQVHVPALLLYEVGNVLIMRSRADGPALDAVFEHLASLPFVVAPPVLPLLTRAGRLARRLRLTFYDAAFVALAVELNCLFVTADRTLYERTRTLGRVRHLSRLGALDR